MVVGGGIAGMQSAWTWPTQATTSIWWKNQSAIGGLMSQLDKTFPTNDCAM
jgi:heterodisulfide reductase subunit A-like polyferredoxin